MLFYYQYTESDGKFHGVVKQAEGDNKTVWEVRYPHFYEDDESGELVPESTLFDEGVMSGADDVDGLKRHLVAAGVVSESDEIVAGGFGKMDADAEEDELLGLEDVDDDDPEEDDEDDYYERLANNTHAPESAWREFARETGTDAEDLTDSQFYGKYRNAEEFFDQLIDEGVINPEDYLEYDDAESFADEEADAYMDGVDDEDALIQADLQDEYDAVGEDDDEEDVDEEANEKERKRIIEEAREKLREQHYDYIYNEVSRNPVQYFTRELGYAASALPGRFGFTIDYDRLESDYSGDFTFVYDGGRLYVFREYYEKGGVTASEAKLRSRADKFLSGSFELPIEVAVLVPSTEHGDKIIGKRDFEKRYEEVSEYVSTLFGGYSAAPVDGGYVSTEKGLIQEDVKRVVAFATADDFEGKFKSLVSKVKTWGDEWSQEAMGLEVEGNLYYVNSWKKDAADKGVGVDAVKTEFHAKKFEDGGGVGATARKYVVTIRDVDMGGDIIYKGDHWFKEEQIKGKSAEDLGKYIMRKYGLDYGNTYKFTVKKTDETRPVKMERGGGFDQHGNAYGFDREPMTPYEYHHKPELDAEKPHMVWDIIDGVYVHKTTSRQRAVEWIGRRELGLDYARGGRTGVDKTYTHFAIRKSDNKIVTGWDYKGVDAEDIRYYSKGDLKDMDFKPADFKILTAPALKRMGIDPFDWANWYSHNESGMAKGGKLHRDLFEDVDSLPKPVQKLINAYNEKAESDVVDYKDTRKLLSDVRKHGYTFDYYLDNTPYALRKKGVKLSEVEGYEDDEAGDAFKAGGKTDTVHVPSRLQKPYMRTLTKDSGEAAAKRVASGKHYAKGGQTTYVLWGVKIGKPDWSEDILFEDVEPIAITDKLKEIAKKRGFDRLRTSVMDMSKKPDFSHIMKARDGGITKRDGQWIKKAIKRKGALRAEAKREGLIEGDEKLSATDLKKLAKKKGVTGKRAALAQTLARLRKKKTEVAKSGKKLGYDDAKENLDTLNMFNNMDNVADEVGGGIN